VATIKRFEDLEVWQLARTLCNEIHLIINSGDFSKDYKLRDQVNGSTGSIMDNIAEGFERDGRKEFIQFLSYAKGSAGEARSQLYRALDRNYISKEKFDDLYKEITTISKMLNGFMSYLRNSEVKGTKFHEPLIEYGNFESEI
jgi:four helix bundle protein